MNRLALHAVRLLGAAAVLACATPARASFALLKVTEVGLTKGGGSAQFIEMGDLGNETFPDADGPFTLGIFDAANVAVGTPIALDLPSLRTNQRAYLISTAAADTAYGVTGRQVLTVTLPTSGQACFLVKGTAFQCVSWGTITTPHTSTETTRAAPGDGLSIQRLSNGAFITAVATPGQSNDGPAPDAGADAGGSDAGTTNPPDAGSATDSGKPNVVPDGGSSSDGGAGGSLDPETPAGDDGGCSVSASHESGSVMFGGAMLGLIGLGLARRRRS
jgi:MYXO-CTERM domain-containing protein